SNYSFTNNGENIIISHLGRLKKVNIETGNKTIIPITVPVRKKILRPLQPMNMGLKDSGKVVSKVIRWPTWNKMKSQLIYSALGKLYTTNIKTGITSRLTNDTILEYAPAISPNGEWVAYSTWDDLTFGHIM